jgi:hypothetical protein
MMALSRAAVRLERYWDLIARVKVFRSAESPYWACYRFRQRYRRSSGSRKSRLGSTIVTTNAQCL